MAPTRLEDLVGRLIDARESIPDWDGILGWHEAMPKRAYLRVLPTSGPLPLTEDEAFIVSSEALIRGLWMDTFLRTDHARLFYQPRATNHILFAGANSADCKDEWRTMVESDLPSIRHLRNIVARWYRGQFTTEVFLGQAARRIAHHHRGLSAQLPLAMSLGSQHRWAEAAEIYERVTVDGETDFLRAGASLQVVNCVLNAGRTQGLERVARRSIAVCRSTGPELLFLVAAARIANRLLIQEAAYWVDEKYSPDSQEILGSSARRKRRVLAGHQGSLPSRASVGRETLAGLGPASRAVLLWA